MGISNFQQYIRRTYHKAWQSEWNKSYDNVYIDLNNVLHHVCYLAKDTKDLTIRFLDYLNGIIKKIPPKKRLILVADGPAPLAKLLLQRKRRLEMLKFAENDILQSDTEYLNLNLSPGTAFMGNLEKSMDGFIKYVKSKHNVEIIISVVESGEGEIKIKKYLQKIQSNNPNDTHIVYSGDSDMILILFTSNNLDNIYQALNKDNIISYGILYNQHIELFGSTLSTKQDFVFLNMFMGNDYIPKVAYLKLENLWDAYKLLSPFFPNGLVSYNCYDVKIDPIFLHDLLYVSTKKIQKRFMNMFKISDLKKSCYDNYVKGLYWTYTMYTSGECADYKYLYDADDSPHVTGVMLSLIAQSEFKVNKSNPIDIDLYGILLIPEKAKSLLTKEQILIAEKLTKDYPVIYEEGRCKHCYTYSKDLSIMNKEYKSSKDDEHKNELSQKIGSMAKSYSKHKDTHSKLTIDLIDKISNKFIECRDDIRETMSIESLESKNSNDVRIDKYTPNMRLNKPISKKLF